jgi:hypothetical protein
MARPPFTGGGEKPTDKKGSCEYIEYVGAGVRKGVALQIGGSAAASQLLPTNIQNGAKLYTAPPTLTYSLERPEP